MMEAAGRAQDSDSNRSEVSSKLINLPVNITNAPSWTQVEQRDSKWILDLNWLELTVFRVLAPNGDHSVTTALNTWLNGISSKSALRLKLNTLIQTLISLKSIMQLNEMIFSESANLIGKDCCRSVVGKKWIFVGKEKCIICSLPVNDSQAEEQQRVYKKRTYNMIIC